MNNDYINNNNDDNYDNNYQYDYENEYKTQNDYEINDSIIHEPPPPSTKKSKKEKKISRLKLRERKKEEFKKVFKIDQINQTINNHVNQQFKLHFFFDLSCLIKAKALYVMLVLYFLLAISYPVVCFFTETNAVSYSWIYFLITALLIISSIIMMTYILFIENRTNSIDMYFIGKGYTRLMMFWVKVLSICTILCVCIFLQSIVLIIFLAVFNAQYAIANFFVANFFGSLLFVIFISPVIICFAMIKSKIAYAILSFVLLLLLVTSIIPRFSPVDDSSFTYKGSNANNYVKATSIDEPSNSSIFEVSDTNFISNDKINNNINPQPPSYTPFMPGELIMSPFIYTYQVNNYQNLDAPANDKFQGNINRLSFIKKGSNNADFQTEATESVFFRSLDENILTMNDNVLRERLIPTFVNFYQKFPANYFDTNSNLSKGEVYEALNDLICQNSDVYYFFAFYQAYHCNEITDEDGVVIAALGEKTYKRFNAIIDAIQSKTSPSFGALIRICVAGKGETLQINGKDFTNGSNTILSKISANNMASELNEIYPYGYNLGNKVNYFTPILESDYQAFLKLFNFSNFDNPNNHGYVRTYCYDAFVINNHGDIELNTQENLDTVEQIQFNLSDAIINSEFQENTNSALYEFIRTYGPEVGNPENWTIETLNKWHEHLKKRYDWFYGYINILQEFAQKRSTPISGGTYENTPFSLYNLNSNWNGPQSFIYTYYGVIKYVPFNQKLLFGAILMVVICIGCWLGLLFINWR